MSRPRRFPPPIAGGAQKTGWEALDKWVGSGSGGSRLRPAAQAAVPRAERGARARSERQDRLGGARQVGRRRVRLRLPPPRRLPAAGGPAAAPSGKTGWEALDKWVGDGPARRRSGGSRGRGGGGSERQDRLGGARQVGRRRRRAARPRRRRPSAAPAGRQDRLGGPRQVGRGRRHARRPRPAPPTAGPGPSSRWRRAPATASEGGRRPDGLPQAPLRRQVGTAGSRSTRHRVA